MTPPHRLRTYLPLFGIIVLGFALRVLWLDRQSLWYDELFTVWVSRLPLRELFPAVAADSQTPWLPYILLHWWPGLWGGEFALRLYSVLPGTLAIAALWRLARVFVGDAQANLAALLLATSPFLISRSQEVRGYTWYLLFTLLACYFFVRLSTGSRWARIGYAVTLPLTLLAHFYGVFLVLAQGLTWWLQPSLRRIRLWPVVASVAMGLLVWWGVMIVVQAGLGVPVRPIQPPSAAAAGRSSSGLPALVQETQALLRQAPSNIPIIGILTGGAKEPPKTDKPAAQWTRLSTRSPFEVASQATLGGEFAAGTDARPAWWSLMGAVYLVLALGTAALAWRRREFWMVAMWAVIPFVAIFIIDRLTAMGFEARYVIAVVPFLFLLVAMGAERRSVRWLVGASLVAMQLVGLYSYYHSPADARDDWRSLVAYLQSAQQPGDGLVAFPAHHYAMAAAVYAPGLPEGGGWVWPDGRILLMPKDTKWRGYGMRLAATSASDTREQLLSQACGYNRLWVVTYTSRVDGDTTQILQDLNDTMTLEATKEFNGPKGLRLRLFDGCRSANGPSGMSGDKAVGP
ncbi:MAG: glycosyltransferase family 39 protein [Anaerolineae bacterium]